MRGILLLAMLTSVAASAPAHAFDPCTVGPYIVFFETDTSALKREQVGVLDNLIENLNDCGASVPHVTGHADTAENLGIVKDRLQAVRNYLASRGLFVKPENMKDLGATSPRIETGPKVSERQNRRVEIIYGRPRP